MVCETKAKPSCSPVQVKLDRCGAVAEIVLPYGVSYDVEREAVCAGYGYEWDINRMTDSAKVLDYLAQVHNKTWCGAKHFAYLFALLDELLHFQGSVCSFGKNKVCSPREMVRKSLVEHPPIKVRLEERMKFLGLSDDSDGK